VSAGRMFMMSIAKRQELGWTEASTRSGDSVRRAYQPQEFCSRALGDNRRFGHLSPSKRGEGKKNSESTLSSPLGGRVTRGQASDDVKEFNFESPSWLRRGQKGRRKPCWTNRLESLLTKGGHLRSDTKTDFFIASGLAEAV